jgi:hypothetical protein
MSHDVSVRLTILELSQPFVPLGKIYATFTNIFFRYDQARHFSTTLLCLFISATMTERIPNVKYKQMSTLRPAGTNNHQSDDNKKWSLDNEIPKKKKFKRPDSQNSLVDEKIVGPWANEMPGIGVEKIEPDVLAAGCVGLVGLVGWGGWGGWGG